MNRTLPSRHGDSLPYSIRNLTSNSEVWLKDKKRTVVNVPIVNMTRALPRRIIKCFMGDAPFGQGRFRFIYSKVRGRRRGEPTSLGGRLPHGRHNYDEAAGGGVYRQW